jgi:hypothetical protein
VRGAAGKARDVAFGLRPASLSASVVNSVQPDILNTSDKRQSSASRAENRVSKAVIRESRITEQPDISPDIMGHKRPTNPDNGSHTDHYGLSEVSPTPPKNPIRAGQALKNILGFFVGLIGWAAKNPVAVLALAVLALWLTVGASCSGPFGKSRDALRLERELAEREAQFQETLRERDEAITAIRTETARTLQQIRLESQRGHDAIAAATPEHEEPIDPALVAAFRDALDGLCVPRADGTRADTCRS